VKKEGNMKKSETESLPNFDSLEELVNYFDTNDMGEHWELMPEAVFEIDLQGSSHLIVLEDDILDDLTKAAKRYHIGSAELVNQWLKEKLAEQGA
jgi:hypothetical protein